MLIIILFIVSLSNGEDFITTEQLQRRMKDIASNSSNYNYSYSNNVLHNNSQKDISDISTDNFPKNGLPEDCTPKKDEDKESNNHGKDNIYIYIYIVFINIINAKIYL